MKTFYAVNLNGKYHTLSRWALYFLTDKGMEILWADVQPGKTVKDDLIYTKIPGMVFYPRREGTPEKYPAYHFVVKGSGLNHLDDLADTLSQHYKEDIEIYHLHGHYPSRHFMEYREYKTKTV